MQRAVLYIILCSIGTGIVSVLYFLLLAAGFVPLPVIAGIVAVCLFFFFRYARRHLMQWVPDDGRKHLFSLAVLATGIIMICVNAYAHSEKYGGWDAWSIWNLQAKYMTSQEHWRNMLLNTRHGHPDYPLMMPGFIAFFSRLLPMLRIETVAFALSFCTMLLIPVLMFLQLRGTGIFIASLVLFMLATDNFYLQHGVSMYADTTLAFFFMSALIAMRQQLTDGRHILLTGALLGCAIWTKNEGVILTAVFCVFYFRELFLGGRVKQFLTGFSMPLLALLLFKWAYAPQNDLVGGLNSDTMGYLQDTARYKQVFTAFSDNIERGFPYLKKGLLVYLLLCLLRRQWPARDMLMIICCAAVYFMVYIVSPQNLEWHLNTSADRLLLQLMPAMVFVMCEYIAGKPAITTFFAGKK